MPSDSANDSARSVTSVAGSKRILNIEAGTVSDVDREHRLHHPSINAKGPGARRVSQGHHQLLALAAILGRTNPIIRGWGHFFRYCTGAERIFYTIDWYVTDRLWRWMRKKHHCARVREIMRYLQRSSRHRRKVRREGEKCSL